MAADPVDALYAGPPEEFIAARDALVKSLRAAGDKEGAAAVKALRRPTVAAWAVNQVVRSAKKDVISLLEVGDRLRDAHEALLDGRGDAGIREATADRRRLVAKLTKAAVARLGPGGVAQEEAISHTFDAAVADPEAGLAVRAGRLAKELEAPSGFGGGLVFGAGPEPAPAARPRREERRAARRSRQTAEPAPAPLPAPDLTKLRREAEERSAEAQQAAREAAAARQEVSRLQDLLVTANAKAKTAADHAQRAQWAASVAQQALREAGS